MHFSKIATSFVLAATAVQVQAIPAGPAVDGALEARQYTGCTACGCGGCYKRASEWLEARMWYPPTPPSTDGSLKVKPEPVQDMWYPPTPPPTDDSLEAKPTFILP